MGNNIEYYREKYKISVTMIAKNLGLTRGALSNKINQSRKFTQEDMIRMTFYFRQYDEKITMEDLFIPMSFQLDSKGGK